jgi:hypothetical protein
MFVGGAPAAADAAHRNLRTGRIMPSQKWTMISLVKQGKFKVGVVPADGLHR